MKRIFTLLLTMTACQCLYGQGVGIGTADPHAPLQFETIPAERKIVLYENADNDHQFIGFGVTGYGELKYQTGWVGNDHVFKSALSSTASQELMRIKGNGFVGIGTDPNNRLDIHYGSPRTGSHPIILPLYVTGDLYEDYGIEFRHSNGTQGIGFGYNTIYATGSDDFQDLKFAARGAGSLIFKTGGFETARINDLGYLGIGVFDPQAQVHLSNTIQHRKIILYDDLNNDFEFFGLGLSPGTLRYSVAGTDHDHVFFAGTSPTSTSELMRLKGTGKVGIGVTDPINKLDLHFGTDRTGTHDSDATLYVTGDFQAGKGVQFRQPDGTRGLAFGANVIYPAGTVEHQDMTLRSKGDGSIVLATNFYERFRITGNGLIGISNSFPHAPLQFGNDVGNRKIVLYEAADNDNQFFGFGVNAEGTFRYQTADLSNDHVFYAGANSTTSNELFRIRGSGLFGMGVLTPLNKLDINYGPTRTGSHPSGLAAYITANMSAAANGVEIRHYNGTEGIGFGYNTIYAAGSMASQSIHLAGKGSTGSVVLKTNSLNRLVVAGNGNVGIGSDTPHGKLQFAQELTNRKIVLAETADDEHQYLGFGLDEFANVRYQISLPNLSHVFYTGTSSTSSKELMRIMGSGNVGINMTNALNRLDINNGAALRTGTHGSSLAMYATGDFGAASNGVEFRKNDGMQGIGFGYNTIYAAGSNTDQDLNLAAKGTAGNLTLTTGGTERLKITGAGNLGLGVTTPINKLDIHSGTARTNTHFGGQSLYVTGNSEFRSADATTGLLMASNNITATGSNANVDVNIGGKGSTGNIIFKTNGAERVRISGSKVGIGTAAPNAPLQFNSIPENRKIVLFETTANDHQFYGFGVNGNILRYQTDQAASDHVFYSAIDAFNSKEIMRMTGDGYVGIGQSVPNAPLQFSNISENRKMVLYDFNDDDNQFIGLGHNITSLRYQVNQTSSDHIFYAGTSTTTSNELMRIEGGGDVGIGINIPANRLDVAAALRTNLHPTTRPLYVTGALGTNTSGVEFRTSDATAGIGIGSNTIYSAGSAADQNLGLEAKGTGYVRFTAGGVERVRVTSTGRIGIGTTAPNAPLQFNSIAETRKIVMFEGGNNDNQFIGFGVNGDGALRYQTAAGGNDHVFYNGTSAGSSNELMRIKTNGFVGIGTITPHANLQLSNTTASRKLVLNETADNNHQFTGFGVEGDASMKYQVPYEWTDHVFYSGAGTGASLEVMRINGNGLVNIPGSQIVEDNATVGLDLTVNGKIITEPFIAPAFLNGFSNYENGYATAGFYKDDMGRVHLKGLVQKATNHNGLAIFTLPEGYRPPVNNQLIFTTQTAFGIARIDVLPNGNVVVMTGSTGWISMDGISFRAE